MYNYSKTTVIGWMDGWMNESESAIIIVLI